MKPLTLGSLAHLLPDHKAGSGPGLAPSTLPALFVFLIMPGLLFLVLT